MGTTPVYAFPYPGVNDSPNGPSQVQALATAVENKIVLMDAVDVAYDARLDKLEGEHAYYKQTTAQTGAIVAATWIRQKFPSVSESSPIITPNGAFDIFTINRTGWLNIEAGIRCNITNVNTVRYLYAIFPGGGFTTPYKVQTVYEPEAAANSTSIGISMARKFTAGDTVALAINRLGVGGGGGNNADTEALGETNHVSFTWLGED
jgi:hypothetical protein